MATTGTAPTVLHSFTGGADGATPHGKLVLDKGGDVYGTATSGGAAKLGVVFKLTPANALSVLHRFAKPNDGAQPYGGVYLDKNNAIYGTTFAGGTAGSGTVFKITPPSTADALLFKFAGTAGSGPDAGLAADSAGILYGTTFNGGANGEGTVFKLLPPANAQSSWNESVMYSFKGGTTDGANPYANVLLGAGGTLYGTASAGGSSACTGGCGMVYKIQY